VAIALSNPVAFSEVKKSDESRVSGDEGTEQEETARRPEALSRRTERTEKHVSKNSVSSVSSYEKDAADFPSTPDPRPSSRFGFFTEGNGDNRDKLAKPANRIADAFNIPQRDIRASSSGSKSTRKWSPALAGTAAGTVNRRFESRVTIMLRSSL
jgi:hypothetical protein